MISITLPWIDPDLSPNARVHRMKKARAFKDAKELAHLKALTSTWVDVDMQAERIPLSITFYPPDKRRRDLDNMHASAKAYIDGVAAALGVDDHRFAPQTVDWGYLIKDGCIVIGVGES